MEIVVQVRRVTPSCPSAPIAVSPAAVESHSIGIMEFAISALRSVKRHHALGESQLKANKKQKGVKEMIKKWNKNTLLQHLVEGACDFEWPVLMDARKHGFETCLNEMTQRVVYYLWDVCILFLESIEKEEKIPIRKIRHMLKVLKELNSAWEWDHIQNEWNPITLEN